jgi:N-acetylneuraminate synthase
MRLFETPPRIVAEIGCNHQGNLEGAERLIEEAARCHVDFVKFQKRDIATLLTAEDYHAPHPEPYHAFGACYGAHREALEFDLNQHRRLQDWCRQLSVGYASSVWDAVSARQIAGLNPAYIKVPSAANTNDELLKILCHEFGGDVHMSLGMTTHPEEERIVELFEQCGRSDSLVLYACTSGYPVAFDEICLLEITRLCETYGERVKEIGFSGHHLGLAADIAAMVLGARWIERHFTLDRTLRGTDHAASLEPPGLQRLVRDVHNVAKALTAKPGDMLEIERVTRAKLKHGQRRAATPRGRAAAPLRRPPATASLSTHPSLLTTYHGSALPAAEALARIRAVVTDVDGVLTDGSMYYAENGDELKRFHTRDAVGLRLLREKGVKVGIITRENSAVVTRRAAKMGVDRLALGAEDKLTILQQWAAEWGIGLGEICYVGDDLNDLPVLRAVGLACVPADAVPPCRQAAHWLLAHKGGEGCVREIADALLAARPSREVQQVSLKRSEMALDGTQPSTSAQLPISSF